MSMISLRVSEKEKELMSRIAKFYGENISNFIKNLFYEKLEDFEDMKAIKEFENSQEYKMDGIPFEKVLEELNFKDEL